MVCKKYAETSNILFIMFSQCISCQDLLTVKKAGIPFSKFNLYVDYMLFSKLSFTR